MVEKSHRRDTPVGELFAGFVFSIYSGAPTGQTD